MIYNITVLPGNVILKAAEGSNLLEVLRSAGLALDAPCGGNGTCGKCRVMVDGREALSCQTAVKQDMTVNLKEKEDLTILCMGLENRRKMNPLKDGYLLAFDIGTTSVVCFLLEKNTGKELASSSMLNPQTSFGADVISRIQAALGGALEEESARIREGMMSLIQNVCTDAGIHPNEISVVSVVGNPAMQQLFMGISPENLAGVPFAPVLTKAVTVPCSKYLPICRRAELLVVPDISGYIGADTIGCVLSTEM